jgi:hypothetical protein
METAQWYGIFIPVEQARWTFVHQTMQDYLAARFWVESGGFSPYNIGVWNIRAAYAACLVPDATVYLERALTQESTVQAIAECLYNNAACDPYRISLAMIEHFDKYQLFTLSITSYKLIAATKQDIFHLASDDLLEYLLKLTFRLRGASRKQCHDLILAYTLDEFRQRGRKLTPQELDELNLLFPSKTFEFQVQRKDRLSVFKLP